MKRNLTPPAFVTPEVLAFALDGQDMTVGPMGVAQIAEAVAVLAPILDGLVLLPEGAVQRLGDGEPTQDDLVELLRLLNEHGTGAFDLVAIGTGMPREKVTQLLPDRFAFLFAAVVVANADFFSRARPVFLAAGELLARAKASQASTGPGSLTP